MQRKPGARATVEALAVRHLEARRVNEDVLAVVRGQDAVDAVAGGLHFRTDDGQFFTHQRVEQRAFTRIGSSEYVDESRFQPVLV